MNRIKAVLILFLAFVLQASHVLAEVRFGSPFKNHMVLQRGQQVPVWGFARPGEQVTLTFAKQKLKARADKAGKWLVNLGKLQAGGPYEMTVKGENTLTLQDVYVGEVWFCSGQSNMEMTVGSKYLTWAGVFNEDEEIAAANYPLIRVFTAPNSYSEMPQQEVGGQWEVVSPQTVGNLSAAAYFFARDLQATLKVPVGLVVSAHGASKVEAWTRREALEAEPAYKFLLDNLQEKIEKYKADTAAQRKYAKTFAEWKVKDAEARAAGKGYVRRPQDPNPINNRHSPFVLWNGMVAPLVPFAVRGVLWYQGESNSETATIYRRQMETLIRDWRAQWGQDDLPFIYVQLANHAKTPDTIPAQGGVAALKREAQLQNLSVPHTAMVVAIDNADPDNPRNIHPKNKQAIGRRLALAARAIAYGEQIAYSGPVYKQMEREADAIRLYFDHTNGGLKAKGNNGLAGFAIAGEDGKFVWGQARIEGETVVVRSPEVAKPVAVRYAWGDHPPVSLYNGAGLPASPFRTDTFEVELSSLKN
ncbi:sialate O-acetylesterase [Pontibacter korlensis]|uniref:Sialate O-acetylesterase domain-containing protein n=1 Tax=Pontibacter korlensis TaxID=400092 RepID=A0A0E3ZH75_9BACT|nr:sialate O-acetylesterase [Pontibacter korlensis]AKD05388.1 hypothetical protein PKOR_23020 [Pontibacter korlensis]